MTISGRERPLAFRGRGFRLCYLEYRIMARLPSTVNPGFVHLKKILKTGFPF